LYKKILFEDSGAADERSQRFLLTFYRHNVSSHSLSSFNWQYVFCFNTRKKDLNGSTFSIIFQEFVNFDLKYFYNTEINKFYDTLF
jgi:hypothetical protein